MKALEDSIKTWEAYASGEREFNEDTHVCALCVRFILGRCLECPYYKTHGVRCTFFGEPYEFVVLAGRRCHD